MKMMIKIKIKSLQNEAASCLPLFFIILFCLELHHLLNRNIITNNKTEE